MISIKNKAINYSIMETLDKYEKCFIIDLVVAGDDRIDCGNNIVYFFSFFIGSTK